MGWDPLLLIIAAHSLVSYFLHSDESSSVKVKAKQVISTKLLAPDHFGQPANQRLSLNLRWS